MGIRTSVAVRATLYISVLAGVVAPINYLQSSGTPPGWGHSAESQLYLHCSLPPAQLSLYSLI